MKELNSYDVIDVMFLFKDGLSLIINPLLSNVPF